MSAAPVRTRQSFRHEAFLWHDHQDFVAGLVPFVLEGLSAGEAVMVAVLPEHAEWLRRGLGAKAADVHFVDMTALGRNPAQIIPAWQHFVSEWSGQGRPARGIGEPIWPGRRPEELLEGQLHEALLNLAVPPEVPFWLLCPYQQGHLDPEVITEAYRSHPAIATADSYSGSPTYGGHAHAHALFTAELPQMASDPTHLVVDATGAQDAFAFVTRHGAAADLASDKVINLANAVRRLAVSSLDRGADWIVVRLWDEPDAVVCEVADRTETEDYLIGRRTPPLPQDECLVSVNRTCDLVQVRSGTAGTTVRVYARK